ncbi:MAG: capsule biosynthesis protein [Actinomycetota bacterium]
MSRTQPVKKRLRSAMEALGVDSEARATAGAVLRVLGRPVPQALELDPADQLRLLVRRGPRRPPATGPRVLFFPIGGVILQNLFEALVMQSLSLRGADVRVAICDRALNACERIHLGTPTDRAARCAGCHAKNHAFYQKQGYEPLLMGALLWPEDLDEASRIARETPRDEIVDLVVDRVPVGRHAYASTLRSLLIGQLSDSPEHDEALRGYLESALRTLLCCRRILAQERPEVVVVSHGIYLWGVVTDFFREHGVRMVVHNVGYRRNTTYWFHHETYHKRLVDEPNALWDEAPFNPADEQILDAYVDSRRTGAMDYLTYHPNPHEGRDSLIRELDLNPNAKIFGLFTNIAWDAAIVFRDIAFRSMAEWVLESIRHFAGREDVQLVIRCHPAEVKREIETLQKVADLVREAFDPLPPNIRLVPAESDVSTYTLSEIVDAGIVYTTKVGLEFACRGVPVVVVGEPFYRSKGFTLDPTSPEEYFRMLETLPRGERLSDEQTARAKKYAYYYFYRRHLELDYLRPYTQFNPSTGFTLRRLDQLLPGRDENLDLICEGILTGREILRPA